MGRLVSNQLLGYPLLLSGLLLACLAKAISWNGEPPLENRYKEHEFLAACREGNLPAVEYYVCDGGVSVSNNYCSGVSGKQVSGLYVAAYNGRITVARFLLKNGADPNQNPLTGCFPLLAATSMGYTELVQVLLNVGAAPNQIHRDGGSPLHMAACRGHVAIARILLQNGALPNTEIQGGWTPLLYAAQNAHKAVVEILLAARADPNQPSNNGWTPLFSAAYLGHKEIVEVLLAAKANPDQQLNNGWTPLCSAACHGHKDVVEVLLATRADPNQQCNDGCSPLFFAAQNGHREIVNHLIAAGADPMAKWRRRYWPSQTPRTAARHSRPTFRRSNPEQYDHYTEIMANLKQAEQHWQRTHRATVQSTGLRNPFARRPQHPEQTVNERTPLLPAMEQLSVSGK